RASEGLVWPRLPQEETVAIILILLGIIGAVLAILAGYLVVALGWIFQRKSPEEVGGILERQERLRRRTIEGRSPTSNTESTPLVAHAAQPIGDKMRTAIFRPSTRRPRGTKVEPK
ncbi:MAG: hypothetical protein ACYDAK_13945, partial [Candidatus Limnocylindrales bacterium]